MPDNDKFMVIFQPSGRRGYVERNITIKEASIRLGVDIEGICGEAAVCGKCKVKIEEGDFEKYGISSRCDHLSPPGPAECRFFTVEQLKQGFRLACQSRVMGDIVIFVPEESRLGKQVVKKAPTNRAINLKPAVKKYYVKLTPASLDDPLGDWERLAQSLKIEYGLKNLTIDYQELLWLQENIRQGNWCITVFVWKDREVIRVTAGHTKHIYGLAVDVGSTTMAGYLCNLESGQVTATSSMMNPQVIYGEDVMSRISYTMTNADGLKTLNRVIIEGLNQIVEKVALQSGIAKQDIVDMTIVGNTCMQHLFLNLDPCYIGRSPFPPAIHHSLDIKAREMGLKVGGQPLEEPECPPITGIHIARGAYVHVLPIEAGFVGSDNVGVLIAEEPYNQDQIVLIIDIGTNGELIMGNRERLISSSCATGPALEGAEIRYGMRAAPGAIESIVIDPQTFEVRFKVINHQEWNTEVKNIGAAGICGSAIIDVVPQMFLAGIIDRSGRFAKGINSPRYREVNNLGEFVIAWARETSINQDIVICQDDIRAIQLAKGAMYAGAKIMMRTLGVEAIDRVVLAGAFGSYINKESAAILGLFPTCDLNNVIAVGNAAGDGARMALLNTDKRQEADIMARTVEYLELTLSPDFDRIFAQAMWIPHMKDQFPHIKHLLSARH